MAGVWSTTDAGMWILCLLKFPSDQRIILPMINLNCSQHNIFYVWILSFQDIYQGLKESQNGKDSIEEEIWTIVENISTEVRTVGISVENCGYQVGNLKMTRGVLVMKNLGGKVWYQVHSGK